MTFQGVELDSNPVDTINSLEAKAKALRSNWLPPDALARKDAWSELIVRTAPTHAVSLVWNADHGRLTADRVQADVAKLHCRVDRKLTKKFNKVRPEDRTGYIGFIERPDTNTHVHLAWRVPEIYHGRFDAALVHWWDRLHPYGSVDVKLIYDAPGWARYISKDQWYFADAGEAEHFLVDRAISL
ncbi:hypothetical protein [Methylorubrum populi]